MARYTFYYERRIRGEVDGESTADAMANVRYGLGNQTVCDEDENVNVTEIRTEESESPPTE